MLFLLILLHADDPAAAYTNLPARPRRLQCLPVPAARLAHGMVTYQGARAIRIIHPIRCSASTTTHRVHQACFVAKIPQGVPGRVACAGPGGHAGQGRAARSSRLPSCPRALHARLAVPHLPYMSPCRQQSRRRFQCGVRRGELGWGLRSGRLEPARISDALF